MDFMLSGVRSFNLDLTLDCGQCFRWKKLSPGDWEGVAYGRYLRISQRGDTLTLHGTTQEEFDLIWRGYFDLDRDYSELFKRFHRNPPLRKALDFAPGIRVLRQEPFETLCSYILSQHNNITRIKGLVSRLCEHFGEDCGGYYAFPAPEALAALSPDDLAPVRCGFRAKYVIDAAKKVSSGEIALAPLYTQNLDDAREMLMRIHGVGRKVSDCVLLYGFAREQCIPEDVWVKRILSQLYPKGFPKYLSPWGGIAQVTLFHYARNCEGAVSK
ncbi:MAG: DNA-3-methyladenine glycosylase 2 family protein [Oscillospiraceae bacterium]|nr:DNA-3-methyladenine glycosylase 2 family protein [Oscillospiraceae bacterium]